MQMVGADVGLPPLREEEEVRGRMRRVAKQPRLRASFMNKPVWQIFRDVVASESGGCQSLIISLILVTNAFTAKGLVITCMP